jgi:hypothetical protein
VDNDKAMRMSRCGGGNGVGLDGGDGDGVMSGFPSPQCPPLRSGQG